MVKQRTEESLDTLSTAGLQVLQPRKGYRYSLDSLILPFFLHLSRKNSVAELGAGSGVISMILAKRCPACRVAALEIQERLYRFLVRNVALNHLEGQIETVHGDIRGIRDYFDPGQFDRVCSNPPFRKARAGRMNPDREKAIARHEVALTLDDLVSAGDYLLRRHGRFALVYLPERLTDLLLTLRRSHLEPRRMGMIHSFPGEPPVLVMVEAVKGARPEMKIEAPFFIYRDRKKNYSDEMQAIYDFPGVS